MNKIYLINFIFILRALAVFGQENIPQIPPSPDAASLGKYGEIPVSLYNGLPEISIPVYEIQARDVSVPITLSYHASGIKVQEESGWAGLGWSLNAGGEITRTVNGNDDFLYSPNDDFRGYIYSMDPRISGDAQPGEVNAYMHQVCLRHMDTEPDIFYFNFQGHSGKFFLQQKKYPGEPVTVKLLSPEKMDFNYNEPTGTWTIWTIDGFKYVFNEKEFTENWAGSGTSEEAARAAISPPSPFMSCDKKFISTWLLTEITSPLGETVTFRYVHKNSQNLEFVTKSLPAISETREESIGIGKFISKTGCMTGSPFENYGIVPMQPGYNGAISFNCLFNSMSGYLFLYQDLNGTDPMSQGYQLIQRFSASMPVYYQAYLNRIDFRDGYVEFITSDREDIGEMTNDGRNPLTKFARPQKLSQIVIRNSHNDPVRQYEFSYSCFNAGQNSEPFRFKRLKLRSFSCHNGDQFIPPFQFNYYEEFNLPSKDSQSLDHWGFYNNALNENTGPGNRPALIPSIEVFTDNNNRLIIKGANREPDEKYTQTGSLKEIIYPTGGATEFKYENHSFNVNRESANLPFKLIQISTVNSNRVIDVKLATEVQFNINLRCTSMACYPGGDQILCEAPPENEPYFTLVNLGDQREVLKEIYADYDCLFDPDSQWKKDKKINFMGNGNLPCGIERQFSLTLRPGKYLIKVNPVNDIEVNISASYSLIQQTVSTNENIIIRGGGLRIKSIIHHDGLDERNNIIKKYEYESYDDQGQLFSSGRLMSFPKYAYGEYYIAEEIDRSKDVILKLRSSTNSNMPMANSAMSGPVGYDRVKEIHGETGTGGYSEYEYINQPDEEPLPYFPNTPANNFAYKNGLILKQSDFDKNHFREREITYTYDYKDLGQVTGTKLLNYSCGDNDMFAYDNYDYIYQQYTLPSEWWFKSKMQENIFDPDDALNQRPLTKTTTFYYNPDHKLVTKTEAADSRGREIIDLYYYPLDLKNIAPAQMWDEKNTEYKHLNNLLIKKVRLVKDNLNQTEVSETTNYYRFDNNIHKVVLDHIDIAANGSVPETRYRFTGYDLNGNLREYSDFGGNDIRGKPVTLLWGYSGSKLIAKIFNAGFYEVSNAASQSGLNLSAVLTINDPGELQKKLELIRNNLPEAVMTFYTYDPLIGTHSISDQNGKLNYFTYDPLQRLQKISDFELNPLTEYQYGYHKSSTSY